MTDHFAALDQPRRPWLDPMRLKDHFHSLTATLHPDIPATGDAARFNTINAAYQILREPAARLRHLIELEAPPANAQAAVPTSIAARFMTIATLRQTFEKLAAEQRQATHALQRALLAPRRAEFERQLGATLADLDRLHAEATADLRCADADWAADRVATLPRLAELRAQFTYLAKWRAQLQEMRFELQAMQ